jgi:hypothetical protein
MMMTMLKSQPQCARGYFHHFRLYRQFSVVGSHAAAAVASGQLLVALWLQVAAVTRLLAATSAAHRWL